MKLNPSQLAGHLQRGLAPIYAVAGDEPLLVRESVDALRVAARADGYSEREVLDAEQGFDWSRLTEVCATGSLFAERRIIEMRLGSAAPGDAGTKALKSLAGRPPQDVVLIVSAGHLDTRVRNSGWFSALEGAGVGIYCWSISADEFPGWLDGRARTIGLRLTDDAREILLLRTEGNLLAAEQELTKLAMLFPDNVVDADAVASAVADSARYEAFDWNDKLLLGDALGAARGLRRLQQEGRPLPALIGALAYDLRQLGNQGGFRGPRHRQRSFAAVERRGGARLASAWLAELSRIDAASKTTRGEARAWEDLLKLALAVSGAAVSCYEWSQ